MARGSDPQIAWLRRRGSGPDGVYRRNAGARKGDDPRDRGDPARQLLRPCRTRTYAHPRRRGAAFPAGPDGARRKESRIHTGKIGKTTLRERLFQTLYIPVVASSLKKKQKT